ncbi:MAG: hypothetical protein ACRDY7_10960 [Acidimicrobiia bacterium]
MRIRLSPVEVTGMLKTFLAPLALLTAAACGTSSAAPAAEPTAMSTTVALPTAEEAFSYCESMTERLFAQASDLMESRSWIINNYDAATDKLLDAFRAGHYPNADIHYFMRSWMREACRGGILFTVHDL